MSENMMRILKCSADQYPYQLEQRYPRILNTISQLWGTPELEEYFADLVLDQRGSRKGFPREVAAEIFRLSSLHKEQHRKGDGPFDPWAWVEPTKRSDDSESKYDP
jgi:hypothetical protein